MVDRRNRVAACERHDLISLGVEEGVVLNHQLPDPLSAQRCEARRDLCLGARLQNQQAAADRTCRGLHGFH